MEASLLDDQAKTNDNILFYGQASIVVRLYLMIRQKGMTIYCSMGRLPLLSDLFNGDVTLGCQLNITTYREKVGSSRKRAKEFLRPQRKVAFLFQFQLDIRMRGRRRSSEDTVSI